MSPEIRTLQVIYGFLPRKLSRKRAERFILLDAADRGIDVPPPPVAQYWCREAPEGAPLPWMIGWTAPTVVKHRECETKALNDAALIAFPSPSTTHECSSAARGAAVH